MGIYLPDPVFAHGKNYVGASRGTKKTGFWYKILTTEVHGQIKKGSKSYFTRNIVYKEVLIN